MKQFYLFILVLAVISCKETTLTNINNEKNITLSDIIGNWQLEEEIIKNQNGDIFKSESFLDKSCIPFLSVKIDTLKNIDKISCQIDGESRHCYTESMSFFNFVENVGFEVDSVIIQVNVDNGLLTLRDTIRSRTHGDQIRIREYRKFDQQLPNVGDVCD